MSKAFVVNDSRVMRSVLSKLLPRSGCHFVQTGNVVEALQVLGAESTQSSLSGAECNIAEINAVERVRIKRLFPRLRKTPVRYALKPFITDRVIEKPCMPGVVLYKVGS